MKQLKTINFFEDRWIEDNPKIIGPLSHGSWMGSPVFDGGRCFNGFAPDLMEHCERIIKSSNAMLMKPPISAENIFEIAISGIKKLGKQKDLYIRPLIWAEDSMGLLRCDPNSAKFCISIIEMPMPDENGFSACTTKYTRPTIFSAPTDAKAACLYPNGARAMQFASEKGFDNAVILDPEGYIAEFASSNLFCVINGELYTPEDNGTFLAGVTRKRVLSICQNLGISVNECKLTIKMLKKSSEIFSSGNFGKIMYLNNLDGINFYPGVFYKKIKKAYWEYSNNFMI